MQRHRDHQIAVLQRAAADAAQPAGESGHEIQAVGMLERQDGAAAFVVIGQDGAGAIKSRRLDQTGGTEIFALQRHRKGQSATGTSRTIQKGDGAPTRRTKARLRHLHTAMKTKRRKQKVQTRADALQNQISGHHYPCDKLVSWFRSNLLVSFDSEIRLEPDIEIMRISESGH